jgi:hypothetical protein
MTQAFLIGNVIYDDIKNELEETINKFIFKNNLLLEENPDIYIIKTEDGYLSKEKIKELLKNLSTTSQFNNTKLYIIEDCEKMSDTVYNAMLKTLEEPSPGIYAVLLTNNIDAVKPTIVSRCQKVFINASKEKKETDENLVIECEEIINNLEKYGIESIAYYNKIYTLINDRDKFLKILYVMMDKYKKALYTIVNDENIKKDDIIFMKNDIKSISKKILIIDKFISLTSNYLNKNLMIDRFIIEMWG